MSVSQSHTHLFAATRKGLVRFRRNEQRYAFDHVQFIGEPVTMFLHDEHHQRLYAALRLGHFGPKLHRSDDNGETWQEITSPQLPKQESASQDNTDQQAKDEKANSVDMIWSMACTEKRIWLGTIPGALFYSDDGGDSWQLVESLWNRSERLGWFGGGYDQPGIHSICIDPRKPERVLIAISSGGVWRTEDNGETWAPSAKGLFAAYMPPELAYEENTQDPHCMVMSASNPDVLWIQHHNGIFLSEDNAHHWRQIKDVAPSDFGFGVAVDPHNENLAWFVPGVKDECRLPKDYALCVTHTRDRGKHFSVQKNGLPTEPSFDLVYRHALVISADSQALAFGSTTGNLWVSTDHGAQWHSLSHTLAPINMLAFTRLSHK